MEDVITLAHGSGGVQTNKLINNIFKKHFDNPYLTADDAADAILSCVGNGDGDKLYLRLLEEIENFYQCA